MLNIYQYGTIIVAIILIIVIIRNVFVSQHLKSSGKIVDVKIIKYYLPGKSMTNALYLCEFKYKEKTKRLISQSSIEKKQSSYEGQCFPAIYSEKYDALRILMNSEDFKDFAMEYPDSLLERFNN